MYNPEILLQRPLFDPCAENTHLHSDRRSTNPVFAFLQTAARNGSVPSLEELRAEIRKIAKGEK
jgi:hypothetical protein